jgi:tetrahydromethanopterin S-methyltransferase subunit A
LDDNTKSDWPPVPGDFIVGNPEKPVAICTLGKKLEIKSDYAIVGTCKTENIGIERIIINVISNPAIRFLILAGPEIPGHLTGHTLRALYNNGVDENTRRIIDAKGAIPYIENVPLPAVERFRKQIELIDMLNNLNADDIEAKNAELNTKNPDVYPESAIWIEFKVKTKRKTPLLTSEGIDVLPEFGITLNPMSSLLSEHVQGAIVSTHPTNVVVRIKELPDGGHTLSGEEV